MHAAQLNIFLLSAYKKWGGISSEEHDEAVMLEAAMFGGIPEGGGYQFPRPPRHLMQNGLGGSMGPYSRHIPRPPSPSLTAQRIIRGQQVVISKHVALAPANFQGLDYDI